MLCLCEAIKIYDINTHTDKFVSMSVYVCVVCVFGVYE